MDKCSLAFLLLVAFSYTILSASNAASIGSATKEIDPSKIWQDLAKLSQQRRVTRQISKELWGGYSKADNDESLDEDRFQDSISQAQAVQSEYDDYYYNGANRRYRRASADKEPMKNTLKIEHKETAEEEEKHEDKEDAPESSSDNKGDLEKETAAASGQSTTATETGTINAQNPNQFSVLILIRNALKKVTTNLPTEQVASNALQYFQLFEHFLQQTIEQVIDDVDEDDEESTTIKIDEVAVTSVPKEEEVVQVENKPEAENLQTETAERVLPIKQITEMRTDESSMTTEQIKKTKDHL